MITEEVMDQKLENEKEKKKKEDYSKKKEDYSIRTINVKLNSKIEDEEKFDENIEAYTLFHDIGVNRYAKLENPTKENIDEEAKKMRRELKKPGVYSGTFVDNAVGKRAAESYFRDLRKRTKDDLYFRDKEIKKIEKENPNLTKLKNVWFSVIKNTEGTCSMCGRDKIFYKGCEPEYDEGLCEVCAVDFFTFREPLKTINRKYIQKNYFLCKDIASKMKLSESLKKEIFRFDKPTEDFKKTISNKFKIKKGQLKMEFDPNIATITLMDGEKIKVGFSGDYYINNFPKYGLYPGVKFRTLIGDHLKRGGYAYLIRSDNDGKNEYYLSIPTHYPLVNKEFKYENIKGCILISQRRVLLFINGKIKFIELFNPYIKKRIYGNKSKQIQKENAELCICDWNRIPKKNHKFLVNLKKKLGFDWVNEHDVTVTKSEDANRVIVKYDDDENKKIEIYVNKVNKTAELRSNDISRKLYIVERKKKSEEVYQTEEKKYRKMELYLQPQIPIPKKYANGNLLKHIKHKNKEVARQIVEETKRMLNNDKDSSSVVLIDYTRMHPEKETVVPMISLNNQIRNMLKYDSIYGGSIDWNHLRILTCPNCNEILPEKSKGKVEGKGRLTIRDIFLSKATKWVCEKDICNKKINNPLIAVAKNIMKGDMKKLLKKKKYEENEEKKDEKEKEYIIKDIIL